MIKRIRQFFAVPPIRGRELTIYGIGVQEKMPARVVQRPSGTGDYLFMVFYDETEIRVGDKMQDCQPGTIMLWEPGRGHFYGNAHSEWKHSWMHCDGRFIARLLDENNLPRNAPIVLPDPWMVDKYLTDIHNELTSYVAPDVTIVENLLNCWLREIARVVKGAERREIVPQTFVRLKAYIEANYEKPLTLSELADHVHLSVPHLCSLFKKYFGMSAIAYVVQLRLHHAAYLLKDRTLSVTEIARNVGYEDIYYFSKLFKTYYGVSPRNSRNAERRLSKAGK
jgi:AraC family transcriptional regulator, arabinose operon regulatory protein